MHWRNGYSQYNVLENCIGEVVIVNDKGKL